MAINDAGLVVAATALKNAVTHIQLFSAATNAGGTTNTIGTRVASTGTVDSDGDITWSSIQFSGLSAGQAVHSVGYFTASSGGIFYGSTVLTGDTSANSAGEFTVTLLTENFT